MSDLYVPPPEKMSEELKKCIEEWRKLYSQIVGSNPNICIDCLTYLPEISRQEIAEKLTKDPDKQLRVACRVAIFIAKTEVLNQRDDEILKDLSEITGLSEDEIARRTGITPERIRKQS